MLSYYVVQLNDLKIMIMEETNTNSEVTKEQVHQFLMGTNPQEHIIKIETDYSDSKVYVIYRDENGNRQVDIDFFYPFVWCKQSTGRQLYGGDRRKLKTAMEKYNIGCKGLRIHDTNGSVHPRMENGYRVMFYAKFPMSFATFQEFFDEGGRPIYPKVSDVNYNLKEYICVSPNEQYMISTGKRLFKGYEDYDDLLRLEWDLETEGLNPKINAISQIGIRTNKGFEKIIPVLGEGEEKLENELKAITEFFNIVKEISPDVMTGHNTENFDWNFIDVRLQNRGLTLLDFTKKLFYNKGIYKKNKQSVLKLGGEIEYYYPTIMWGHNLTDSLFAVRRAQALDSNIKKADLKYITKYSKLNKPNRVYVPGKIINTTWSDTTKSYAFNNDNGEWFKVTKKLLEKTYTDENGIELPRYTKTDNKLIDNSKNTEYEFVSGRYIVERYLLDDLYETDKVELQYNQSNFLVGKMLPVSFEKMCTMGTAAIWKYIMLAWSYEHGLAIPELIESKPFTGGLSRLLKVGYVDRIVKLDFNSLYPSIILTFNIKTPVDVMGVMNAILEYILTQREHYKGLKAEAGGKAKKIKKQIEANPNVDNIKELKMEQQKYESIATKNDKMQLPLKITGNAFFGSYGSGSVFPHSDLVCAEETTCTGRMMLRLMISHFTEKLGYTPIVGDSFTEDTPIFIKYKDTNDIDIVPVSQLINEEAIQVDEFEREYDTSEKNFRVLCRSGWREQSYIYRHKTDKDIYRVTDGDMMVDVTEDHSLFNDNMEKIKPSEVTEDTKLEYHSLKGLISNKYTFGRRKMNMCAVYASGNRPDAHVVKDVLNSSIFSKKYFLEQFEKYWNPKKVYSKQIIASIQYIKLCVQEWEKKNSSMKQ